MKKKLKAMLGLVILIGVFFLSSAAVSAHSNGDEHGELSKQDEVLLKKATARYHSVKQAEKAGYFNTQECVAIEGVGGMGIHFINPSLVDGEVTPGEPEALLYEPTKSGLKLVGVEYISTGENELFGQQFDPPHAIPEYSLHVWIWKDNPAGTFTGFNPTVLCGE